MSNPNAPITTSSAQNNGQQQTQRHSQQGQQSDQQYERKRGDLLQSVQTVGLESFERDKVLLEKVKATLTTDDFNKRMDSLMTFLQQKPAAQKPAASVVPAKGRMRKFFSNVMQVIFIWFPWLIGWLAILGSLAIWLLGMNVFIG